ncbi:MAG: DUF4390 domain-containing protein [Rhodocyclaceae bacterium]|nr:DUF4390 domain-containing protein [Rhodocyclaceae bacterium]
MTASIMRCCRRLAEVLFALCFAASAALAGDIGMRDIRLAPAEDSGFALSADFDIEFSQRLEEAVGKGLALHFVTEFELTRPRWYWFDEKVAKAGQTWRLTYHALTRQYRLSTGILHQSFASLAEALHVLSRLRHWQVVEAGRVQPGETFIAGLRIYLDVSQLPKPFQVEALSNKDWVLTSDWRRWSFTVPPPAATGGEAKQ